MARVLHIEDDPKNRLLVRKLLSAAGHEVIDAETGLAGVRLADSHHPDLVLVDINIPDLDGYEVILRLRGTPALSGVPIVAITAEGDRETSLAVGADGFIGKPIDARKFPKTVGRFLGGHRERPVDGEGQHLRRRSQKIVERLERKVVELEQANHRLEEMVRLRQEFLRNVSHELATPMTPVVGYLRLLLDEELGQLTPLQRKCLESVSRSTQRLRTVVDTLLDVSSLETDRMHFYEREYDFTQCVRAATEEVRELCDESAIQMHIVRADVLTGPARPASGDPDKLRRALVHVLENAVKFTGRGGQVAVAIEDKGPGEGRRPGYAVVVADSGPGVSADQLPRILEPFYQVDGSVTRAHGGVGLGLAFARHVCEAHGGGIRIISPPDREVAGQKLQGTLVQLSVLATPDPIIRQVRTSPDRG